MRTARQNDETARRTPSRVARLYRCAVRRVRVGAHLTSDISHTEAEGAKRSQRSARDNGQRAPVRGALLRSGLASTQPHSGTSGGLKPGQSRSRPLELWCPLRIEAALGRRFGQITRVSASLVSGRVTVQWDAASPLQARDLLGPRTLLEAVEALGCRDLFSRTCECLENRADEKPSHSLRKGTARRSPSTRASRARSPTRARRRGA